MISLAAASFRQCREGVFRRGTIQSTQTDLKQPINPQITCYYFGGTICNVSGGLQAVFTIYGTRDNSKVLLTTHSSNETNKRKTFEHNYYLRSNGKYRWLPTVIVHLAMLVQTVNINIVDFTLLIPYLSKSHFFSIFSSKHGDNANFQCSTFFDVLGW